MKHDFEEQRRETWQTFAEAGGSLPGTAVVDFIFFVEETDADWDAFAAALRKAGFRPERQDDGETLIARCGPMPVTPEDVWAREREATEIALRFEFYPDGWDLPLAG